ncbi:hypothetical protein WBG78_11410 [Chryseolinea sp. T2]|uniref:hypothetical protein n=1 Tax=Chryseolinea sp. T2 TaxID=3129255 RepID=UPI003077594E
MDSKSIEAFFLNTLLKFATAGVFIITMVDFLFYPEDRLSIIIDLIILGTCLISYAIRQQMPGISMLIFTSVILIAMIYQSLVVPLNTTISLSIILLDGFIVSVMLKGNYKVVMHTLIVASVIVIFIIQFITPSLRFSSNPNEMLTVLITYLIVYFNLAYPAAVLKKKYDVINQNLTTTNEALTRKTSDMADQNAVLTQAQTELNSLNTNLERILNERMARIQAQNEKLVRYSYNNAHHLRGPVARLLGLAAIYKVDAQANADFIIAKMLDQAHEIDAVVKMINEDLEAQDFTPH